MIPHLFSPPCEDEMQAVFPRIEENENSGSCTPCIYLIMP